MGPEPAMVMLRPVMALTGLHTWWLLSRRRATQVVMARAFDAVCRLLAPILAYTADEAWEFAGHATSVHTALFPKADPALRDKAAEAHFEQWLELRSVLAQAMEPARKEKLVGNAQEAAVEIEVADEALLAGTVGHEEELEEVLQNLKIE